MLCKTAHTDNAERWSAAIWNSPPALSYLRGRGVSDASIRDWKLGYCDDATIMGHRITFPIYDFGGNVISISGRTIVDDIPKAWHFPFRKERYVYGLHLLSPCPYVVLVEGQTDAVLVRQAGFHTVAVMGSSLSPIAASFLRLFTDKAVCYPDSESTDSKAFGKCMKWIPSLEAVGIKAAFPQRPYWDETCSDPADIVWDRKRGCMNRPEWLREQVEQAVSSITKRDTLELP